MIRTLLDLLGSYYANNDMSNFMAIARGIQAAIPTDQVSLQFIGLAHYRNGRINDALRILDKITIRLKRTRVARGTLENERAHGVTAAEVCYREATLNSPGLSKAWYEVGMVLKVFGKYEQAIHAFSCALIAQPEKFVSYVRCSTAELTFEVSLCH